MQNAKKKTPQMMVGVAINKQTLNTYKECVIFGVDYPSSLQSLCIQMHKIRVKYHYK